MEPTLEKVTTVSFRSLRATHRHDQFNRREDTSASKYLAPLDACLEAPTIGSLSEYRQAKCCAAEGDTEVTGRVGGYNPAGTRDRADPLRLGSAYISLHR